MKLKLENEIAGENEIEIALVQENGMEMKLQFICNKIVEFVYNKLYKMQKGARKEKRIVENNYKTVTSCILRKKKSSRTKR